MTLKSRRISAYALILHEDQVLLSKLNRGPNSGKWNLVGGGIEHGELPEDALLREIQEEAGITLKDPATLLSVMSDRYVYKNAEAKEEDLQLIGIIYLVRLSEKVSVKFVHDEHTSDGCQWFPMTEITEKEMVPFVIKSLALLP